MYDLPTLVNNSLWFEFKFHDENHTLSIDILQDIHNRAKDQLAHLQCVAAELEAVKPAGVLKQLELRVANLERLLLKNQCSVLEAFIYFMSVKMQRMTEECLTLLDTTDQDVASPMPSPALPPVSSSASFTPLPMLFSQVAELADQEHQEHLETMATHSLASGSRPPSPLTIQGLEEVGAAFAPGVTAQSISPDTTTKKRPKACPKSKKLQQDQAVREVVPAQAEAKRRSPRLTDMAGSATTKKARYKV